MKMKRIVLLFLAFVLIASCLPEYALAAKNLDAPKVTASNILSSGQVRLTWKAVKNARYYRIYRADREDGDFTKIKTTSSLSFTDKSVQPGQTRYYRINTVAADGSTSPFCETVSVTGKLPRTNVTLSAVKSSGRIKISWEKVEGASSYRIYRSENNQNWSLIKKTTSHSFIDESTQAGVKYYYQVTAVLASNTAGNSARSASRSFTCDLPRPVITVSNLSDSGRVRISWEPIEGAVRYRVYRATSKSGSYSKIGSPEGTSFTDTTGTADKTYYYKVMAISSNSAAHSAYSAVKSGKFVYLDGLTLTAKLGKDGKPQLTWNEVKGATGYRVYRSLTRTGGYQHLSTRTRTSYPNSSAPEGLTLYYKIKAVNASGKVLETSNVASVTTTLSGETLKTRYVAVPMVKLYESPDASSDAIRLRYMEKLKLGKQVIDGGKSGWYRVFYKEELMYLWMEDGAGVLTATKSSESYTGTTKIQQEVLDLALDIANNWKTTYAHDQSEGIADSDGTYGFDCSGFVEYVLETVMRKRVPTYDLSASISVMHATTGIYNVGYSSELTAQKVSKDDLQPGDILFFTCAADGSVSNSIGHCGIYLGNNEFVHSTTAWEDAVCIMPLNDRFAETLHSVRRFLPTSVSAANIETTLDGPYRNYKVYAQMDPDSEVVTTIAKGETFTLLFTDNGNWAYVRTEDGIEGFTRAEHLA